MVFLGTWRRYAAAAQRGLTVDITRNGEVDFKTLRRRQQVRTVLVEPPIAISSDMAFSETRLLLAMLR